MKTNPVTLILVFLFLFPIARGFLFKFSSYDLKRDTENLINSISFIVAIFIGIRYYKVIFLNYENSKIYKFIPSEISSILASKPYILYFIIIPIFVYIVYKLISVVLNLIARYTFFNIYDVLDRIISNKSNTVKRIIGAVVQVPRAVCYLVTVLFLLNAVAIINPSMKINSYLKDSKAYNYLCKRIIIPVTNSSVAKSFPNILDNSFKIVTKTDSLNKVGNALKNDDNASNVEDGNSNVIVYYNGVTLDEGIRSNDQINNFARSLTSASKGNLNKARKLYDWIGYDIDYDYQKANMVLNNNYNVKSGAIPTFNTRKGICFDYSCLYVAMARANNIKVRLVTGEGFNGTSWVSHAWNQVYVPEMGTWINVDTTFAKGGNYFNNGSFNIDHRNSKVIGEW
ncbi:MULTISPECIES: transglutaminase domain-containing protein [Clostridium]|uniref:Transglutaminase-like enzyme, putative cysteine protease n=1 Tax=Clostridium acetobutylicum (strain ATCC 824 / DSM 792 / JCM 1419 / IAM 19013 / LMG 5710 / NBRC 13948 / NRRL B-527 / VKM B-1787 / 2291 / W) TaxID=272562 RepID=Q97GF8_CLOAB|nr:MULTISPECIES: transglutaminase domain-containing protein [Clostridium]AAK80364.1 Transglutaminase-like enzyme, putative cysteine protease [Clostridium acetobutylicum ATCC 824]ADZ21461.1 Transglutaminase-like enzyme, putative cysteine protease [Clostridium acetobutylicum EA 2018]AEI32324.1 transglutaminase-like enzyme, putative cysteine protease [Clostridium acetobutylicum DSM 1731]AWV79216.1 transglutaminase domain-containing protein [Clostridium acetobutylicum]MBC2394818.1 transglutaminase